MWENSYNLRTFSTSGLLIYTCHPKLPAPQNAPKFAGFQLNPSFWVLSDFGKSAIFESATAKTADFYEKNVAIHYICNFFSRPYIRNEGAGAGPGIKQDTRRRFAGFSVCGYCHPLFVIGKAPLSVICRYALKSIDRLFQADSDSIHYIL